MTNVSLTMLTLARHQLHELVPSTEDDFNMFNESDKKRPNKRETNNISLLFSSLQFPQTVLFLLLAPRYTWYMHDKTTQLSKRRSSKKYSSTRC